MAQIMGDVVDRPVPDPVAEMIDLPPGGLCYAAQRVKANHLPLDAERAVMRALVSSDKLVLLTFFIDILGESNDSQIRRAASRGIERVLQKAFEQYAGSQQQWH
jgi:hypothetical protein